MIKENDKITTNSKNYEKENVKNCIKELNTRKSITTLYQIILVYDIYGINGCQFAEEEINDFQLKIQNTM